MKFYKKEIEKKFKFKFKKKLNYNGAPRKIFQLHKF